MDAADDGGGIGILSPLIGYELRRALGAFLGDFTEEMKGTGMRQMLIGILAIVASQPGIRQGDVGRILGVKRANMVSLINELLAADLLHRAVDARDGRAFVLNLTKRGDAKLAECQIRILAHEARMLADFTEDEVTQLHNLLRRIPDRRPAAD